jgi:hypothetical protein
MLPYYLIFAVFAAIAVSLKIIVIDPHVSTWFELILAGICIMPVLLLVYFLVLFYATNGMKYFIARKPTVYRWLHR